MDTNIGNLNKLTHVGNMNHLSQLASPGYPTDTVAYRRRYFHYGVENAILR